MWNCFLLLLRHANYWNASISGHKTSAWFRTKSSSPWCVAFHLLPVPRGFDWWKECLDLLSPWGQLRSHWQQVICFNGDSLRSHYCMVGRCGKWILLTRQGGEEREKHRPVNDPRQKVKRGPCQKSLCSSHFNLNEPHLQMWPPHFDSPQRSRIREADFRDVSVVCHCCLCIGTWTTAQMKAVLQALPDSTMAPCLAPPPVRWENVRIRCRSTSDSEEKQQVKCSF